jgi:hypothetical protein
VNSQELILKLERRMLTQIASEMGTDL